MVSVTAEGLGGGSICAPNNTWTLAIQKTFGSGVTSLTQATYYSVRPTANAENYTFVFRSGNCPFGGSPVAGIPASAVLVRYTGVDTVTPLDDKQSNTVPKAPDTNPGTKLYAPYSPALTTSLLNDRIVNFYGTGATAFSAGTTFSQAGASTDRRLRLHAGHDRPAADSPATAATGATSAPWVAQAFAVRDARSDLTIARPANKADNDFLLVSVTAAGLGNGTICAPDATWTPVGQDMSANGLTQQTFKSFRVGAGAETYSFTFAQAAWASSEINPPASAVLVRYTGVDPANPIDAVSTPPPPPTGGTGTGTTVTAPLRRPST